MYFAKVCLWNIPNKNVSSIKNNIFIFHKDWDFLKKMFIES